MSPYYASLNKYMPALAHLVITKKDFKRRLRDGEVDQFRVTELLDLLRETKPPSDETHRPELVKNERYGIVIRFKGKGKPWAEAGEVYDLLKEAGIIAPPSATPLAKASSRPKPMGI